MALTTATREALEAVPPSPENGNITPDALAAWRSLRAASPATVIGLGQRHADCAWASEALKPQSGAEILPEPWLVWVESGADGLWPAAVLRATFDGETRRVLVGRQVITQTAEAHAGKWLSV